MLNNILKRLPQFKGKNRIAKLLMGKFLQRTKDIIIDANDGLKYKLPNLVESIAFSLYVNGYYEKETIDFILEKLPLNANFIDVGANIGAISLPLCKKRTDIKAICIEASPKVYAYLKFNVELNNVSNAILINKAVNDDDGKKISFFSPDDLFGKGSMSPIFTEKSEEVETTRLTSIISKLNIGKIDFLKVDVEGYEFFVFKGAKDLLVSENAPDIIFEFLDWAETDATKEAGIAQRLLIEYGYKLYNFDSKNKVQPLANPIVEGGAMIFATKQNNANII